MPSLPSFARIAASNDYFLLLLCRDIKLCYLWNGLISLENRDANLCISILQPIVCFDKSSITYALTRLYFLYMNAWRDLQMAVLISLNNHGKDIIYGLITTIHDFKYHLRKLSAFYRSVFICIKKTCISNLNIRRILQSFNTIVGITWVRKSCGCE